MELNSENPPPPASPPAPPPAGENLRRTAGLLVVAKFLPFGVSVALPFLVVRQLNQHDFGVYKQLFLLIASGANILMLGFPMSSYYFFPRTSNRTAVVSNIITFLLGMGTAMSLVGLLWPGGLAWLTNDASNAQYAAPVGLASASYMVATFLETVALVNHEVKIASSVMLVGSMTRSGLILFMAWTQGTVKSLLWAMIVHSLVLVAGLFWYLATRFPGFWRMQDWGLFRQQLRYVLDLSLPAFVMNMQADLHQYVVSRRYGPAQFAIYANGCLQVPVTLLTEAVGPLLVRRVSEYEESGQKAEIVRLTLDAGRMLALVYFPVTGVLIVLGREFLTFLYTARYLPSYPIFIVNMLIIPMGVILFDPISRAYPECQIQIFRLRLLLLGGLIVALFVLQPWFGMQGVILGLAAMTLVDRITIGRFWVRKLEADRAALLAGGREFLRIVAASVLAGLAVEPLRRALQGMLPFWILALGGIAYAVAYLAALWMVGGIRRSDVEMARGMLRRGN